MLCAQLQHRQSRHRSAVVQTMPLPGGCPGTSGSAITLLLSPGRQVQFVKFYMHIILPNALEILLL